MEKILRLEVLPKLKKIFETDTPHENKKAGNNFEDLFWSRFVDFVDFAGTLLSSRCLHFP